MRVSMMGRAATGRVAFGAAIAFAAFTFALLGPAALGAQEATYSATLTGAAEVPAVESMYTGTFTATVDGTAETITYTLSVPTILAATAAHIHQAAAGENGPVVLALYSSAGEDLIDLTATLGAADLAGPLAGDWAGLVAGLADGSLYVNVHTVANAGGEIRGQLGMAAAPAPAPTATPEPALVAEPAATGNAGLVMTAGGSTGAALSLLVLSLVAIAGGRLLTGRASRR